MDVNSAQKISLLRLIQGAGIITHFRRRAMRKTSRWCSPIKDVFPIGRLDKDFLRLIIP